MKWTLKLMRKSQFLFFCACMIFLIGCGHVDQTEYMEETRENITYAQEDVIGTIKDLNVQHWYYQKDRWEWRIIVQYEDLTLIDDGCAEGFGNEPNFIYKNVGDKVDLVVVAEYVNGIMNRKFIQRIK